MKSIEPDFIANKLRELGPSLLKSHYAENWTPQNPTYGYCYILSEAMYHFSDENVSAYCLNFGRDIGTHWYLKCGNTILDFTAEQFNFPIPYEKGVRKGFFKGSIPTPRGFISKRGFELARHLELV